MPRAVRTPGPSSAREPLRKPTNVTLPAPLLAEARALGVSVSQACERGLAATVAEARARKWLDDNQAAIEAWNEYVETNGLPLAEFRQF
ncbi:MAG TPA: type II toxin-antitoxin system CcdA family antitoxin [Acetobacteraceae bacterium]